MPDNDDDYRVGYKRPPRSTRFKPGQSGNKKGRPRKEPPTVSEAISRRLLKIFRTTVDVPNGDGTHSKISILEAGARKCLQQAIQKGNMKAFSELVDLAEKYEVGSEKPTMRIIIEGGLPKRGEEVAETQISEVPLTDERKKWLKRKNG